MINLPQITHFEIHDEYGIAFAHTESRTIRHLCMAVKIFALIIFVSACGDIDQDADFWDLSECYEWETIHDKILESDRVAIVEIDERPHRVVTESNQNAWVYIFDEDDTIVKTVFVISDMMVEEINQDVIAVVPHREEIAWRLVIEVHNGECNE